MSIHRRAVSRQRGFEVKGETRLSKARVVSSNVVDYTMPLVLVKHLALSAVDLDSADTQAGGSGSPSFNSSLKWSELCGDPPQLGFSPPSSKCMRPSAG